MGGGRLKSIMLTGLERCIHVFTEGMLGCPHKYGPHYCVMSQPHRHPCHIFAKAPQEATHFHTSMCKHLSTMYMYILWSQ